MNHGARVKRTGRALMGAGHIPTGSYGIVLEYNVGLHGIRVRWEPPAFWPYEHSWFDLNEFTCYNMQCAECNAAIEGIDYLCPECRDGLA